MNLVNVATRRRLETHHAEAAAEIASLERTLDDTALESSLLALCADYFEAALAGRHWTAPASPSPLETACLDVCEQFMVSVSDVRDEQIAALREHLSADDVYVLMSAIYLIEMAKRLDLTLERVLP